MVERKGMKVDAEKENGDHCMVERMEGKLMEEVEWKPWYGGEKLNGDHCRVEHSGKTS